MGIVFGASTGEPSHLLSPPSRMKRGILYQDKTSPASRPASGAASTQTGEVLLASEPVQEKEHPVTREGGTGRRTSRNGGMRQWARSSSHATAKSIVIQLLALEVLEDMDQLYGYCDCMGWAEDD